jgi:hypothetical protein
MRPPEYPAVFATLLGMGIQIYCMVWLFLLTVSLASTSMFFRPFLFLCAFIYSALTGFANGWVTGKVMKFYGATDWLFAASASSVIFPIYLFCCLMAVDLIEWL